MIRKYILLFLLLYSLAGNAQHQDFRTWINFQLEGELFNLIDYSLTPELRLQDNLTQVEGVLGEVDLSVPLTKFLRLGTEYRYKVEFPRDDPNEVSNRLGLYAEFKERIADFRLQYRVMYLQEYTNVRTSEQGYLPETMHRHKFSVKYRQKGWDITPGIAAEGFFTINPLWNRNEFKCRFAAGVQYKLTKDINLSLNYKYQREFNQNDPLTAHILDIGLEYEL